MEKKKRTKFQITTMLLLVVCATICCTAIFGSSEQVAKADYTTTDNDGRLTYTMSRLTIPVVFEHLNNDTTHMGWASIGLKFSPYNNNRHMVGIYTYYYAINGIDDYVVQADPYPATFVPEYEHLNYAYIPVNGSSFGLPTDMLYTYYSYFDINFVGNVHYVEIGNSHVDGLEKGREVLGADLFNSIRSEMLYFTYFKFTQFDGASAVLAFQTMVDEGMPNMNAFLMSAPPYRKYYTISLGEMTTTEQYEKGKADGKAEGFVEGLREGQSQATQEELENSYREGYTDGLNESGQSLATFEGWGNAVLGLLNVPLFGTFSLGTIIALLAGISLLFFLLNLLKG